MDGIPVPIGSSDAAHHATLRTGGVLRIATTVAGTASKARFGAGQDLQLLDGFFLPLGHRGSKRLEQGAGHNCPLFAPHFALIPPQGVFDSPLRGGTGAKLFSEPRRRWALSSPERGGAAALRCW